MNDEVTVDSAKCRKGSRTNQRGGGQPGSLGWGSQRSCCLLRVVFRDVEPDVHLGEDRQAEEGWAQSLGEKGLKSPTRTPRMLNVQEWLPASLCVSDCRFKPQKQLIHVAELQGSTSAGEEYFSLCPPSLEFLLLNPASQRDPFMSLCLHLEIFFFQNFHAHFQVLSKQPHLGNQ